MIISWRLLWFIMKTEKEIQTLKKELLEKLDSIERSYYGLSLENLVYSN